MPGWRHVYLVFMLWCFDGFGGRRAVLDTYPWAGEMGGAWVCVGMRVGREVEFWGGL